MELRERGIVEKVKEKEYIIRVTRSSMCGSCSLKNSCSFQSGRELLKVPREDEHGLREGDIVELVIPARRVVYTAFLLYGVPTLTLLIITFLIRSFGVSDGWAVFSGFIAMALSFTFLRLYDLKKGRKFRPRIEKVLLKR